MRPEFKQWIADLLNLLPMVEWDRFTGAPDGSVVNVYGWIRRERDGRADFVLMEFHPFAGTVGFDTSSAKHSEEIARLLGIGAPDHWPCERVEHELGGLVKNVIHL